MPSSSLYVCINFWKLLHFYFFVIYQFIYSVFNLGKEKGRLLLLYYITIEISIALALLHLLLDFGFIFKRLALEVLFLRLC